MLPQEGLAAESQSNTNWKKKAPPQPYSVLQNDKEKLEACRSRRLSFQKRLLRLLLSTSNGTLAPKGGSGCWLVKAALARFELATWPRPSTEIHCLELCHTYLSEPPGLDARTTRPPMGQCSKDAELYYMNIILPAHP